MKFIFALIIAFTSLPAWALHGTWESDSATLNLLEDGTFTLTDYFDEDGLFVEQWAGLADTAGVEPIKEVWFDIEGTWREEGNAIQLAISSVEIHTDRGPYSDVILELGMALAQRLADEAGISDEDYPAFEEQFLADFLGGLDESTLTGGPPYDPLEGQYGEDSGVLVLEDEEFTRSATAVSGISWGRIKQSMKQ